ncbi:MAG: hypothetical protein KDK36_17040 [Leptospiraceae bacterium]|nr:hypothetical protein [Leptospiraceae bacterium]
MNFINLIRNAISIESQGQFAGAFNLYNNAMQFSKNPKTLIKLTSRKAWCQNQVGNHNEAENLFNGLISSYPENPESFLETAIYYFKIHEFKKSKNLLTKGIERFPYFLEFYLTLSYILKETGRTNESIDILKKALLQDKLTNGKGGIKKKDIWAELADLYFERGNYNSCITSLKKSLRLEDNCEEFQHYSMLAICYLKINDPSNALKYIDIKIKIYDDRDPEDYTIKARAHAGLGELHLASSCLLQAYDKEGFLKLSSEDMKDFSKLTQRGFFETIENVIIDNELL